MSNSARTPALGSQSAILHWTGQVLTEERLRSALQGHREVRIMSKAIVTPLARDFLRERGIACVREEQTVARKSTSGWSFVLRPDSPLVRSAIRAVERESINLQEWNIATDASFISWSGRLARELASGTQPGTMIFCADAGLLCCIANKVQGVRAIVASSVAQAARAMAQLGPNLVAVEMPGPTYFELRQILRTICSQAPQCPQEITEVLKDVETDAHR